ncbi:unnamed protein product [Penicillium manginii]
MSGVVISEYWLREMGNPSTVMTGTITALYDIGGVFGALIAAFTVESLGRKRGLMVGAALIVIGSVLMGVSVERVLMIVGRIITGLVPAKLRNKPEDDPVVQKEKSDILSAINIESEEEGTWKSLFMDGGCAANKQFFLALGIQFMQQTSGKPSC